MYCSFQFYLQKNQQCVVTVMSEMEKLYHFTAAVAHLAVFDLSLAAYRR